MQISTALELIAAELDKIDQILEAPFVSDDVYKAEFDAMQRRHDRQITDLVTRYASEKDLLNAEIRQLKNENDILRGLK